MTSDKKIAWVAAIYRAHHRISHGLLHPSYAELKWLCKEAYIVPVCDRRHVSFTRGCFREYGAVRPIPPAQLSADMETLETLCSVAPDGGPPFIGDIGYAPGSLLNRYDYKRPEQGFDPFVMSWDGCKYEVRPSPLQVVFEVTRDGVADTSEFAQELAFISLNYPALRT